MNFTTVSTTVLPSSNNRKENSYSSTTSYHNYNQSIVASPPLTPIISPSATPIHQHMSNPIVSDVNNNIGSLVDSSSDINNKGELYNDKGSDYYCPSATTIQNDNKVNVSTNSNDNIFPCSSHSPRKKGESHQQQRKNKTNKHVCQFNFCGWSFKRYEHLKRHMLVHTGERPYKCQFAGCGKSFSRSDNFYAHYRTHTKKKNCATISTNKKSAAVTTVPSSAAVTDSVTSTPNDSSDQFMFLPNQQCQNFIPSNGNAVSSVATTAAITAVSQQNQSSQVFYNSRLCNNNRSTTQLDHGYFDSNKIDFANTPSPPISIFHHQDNNLISSSTLLSPPQLNLSSSSSSSSPNNSSLSILDYNPDSIFDNTSCNNNNTNPFFHSPISSQYYMPSFNNYAPTYTSTNNSCYPLIQQHPSLISINNTAPSSSNNKINTTLSPYNTKPHTCPISQCSRRFKRLEHLKRHMRIHTLERPFQCTYQDCKKKFSRSDNLSQHIKTHQKHLK